MGRQRKVYAKPTEQVDLEKSFDTMLQDINTLYDELDKADKDVEKYKKQQQENYLAFQNAINTNSDVDNEEDEITLDDIARGGKLK